jgi:hypothetical protein
MKQENCPVCRRLLETFKTKSGREVRICSADPSHQTIMTFPADPTLLQSEAPAAGEPPIVQS